MRCALDRKRLPLRRFLLACLLAPAVALADAGARSCAADPVAVQILGSGGPWLNGERASTAYLLWVGDRAKVLVDMGGGAFLRFGQSQARLGDLSLVALSHFHPDHVSDLPALLWLSSLTRQEPLPIAGPSGNAFAPSLPEFLRRMFDGKDGAFQVLGGTLGGPPNAAGGGGVRLDPRVADAEKLDPTTVYESDGLTVTALGVPHANIPTLAYRVTTHGVSVVFGADQNGGNPRFVDFARGANVLILHLAVAAGVSTPLHAPPATVGRLAQSAGVRRLIVSHFGQFDLDAAVAELRKSYTGPLTVGADLQCTQVR